MEIAEKPRRKYRKRNFPRDESSQATPFPETPAPATETNIREDAAAKEKILEAAKQIPEIFTPEQVEWCFDAYVGILSFVYAFALHTDFKALYAELKFEDDVKKAMSKPLSRICSKYAPAAWAAMAPEIELVTMLGLYTVSSFGRAKAVAEKQEEKKRDSERTRPVAPINERREVHVPA